MATDRHVRRTGRGGPCSACCCVGALAGPHRRRHRRAGGLDSAVGRRGSRAPRRMGLVARALGSLAEQLDAARGEVALVKLQLERANAIMANSTKYQIPADLRGDHLRYRAERGDRPGAGISAGQDREQLQGERAELDGAFGYTQLQVATAQFYEPNVHREGSLRPGYQPADGVPVPERPAGPVQSTPHLALLAYNRGPAKVAEILARGRRPGQRLCRRGAEGLRGAGDE